MAPICRSTTTRSHAPRLHPGDRVEACGGLLDEEVGTGEGRLELAAQRREVTGDKDGGHGIQRSGAVFRGRWAQAGSLKSSLVLAAARGLICQAGH